MTAKIFESLFYLHYMAFSGYRSFEIFKLNQG